MGWTKYLYVASCISVLLSFLSACVVLVYFTVGTVGAGGSMADTILHFWIYNHNFWFLLMSLTLIYFLRVRYGVLLLALYLVRNIKVFHDVFNNLGYADYDFFNKASALFGLLMLIFGFIYYILLWQQWFKLRKAQS